MAACSMRLVLLLLSYLVWAVAGLEVTPGSSCSTFCLDSGNGSGFDPKASTTNTSDISCKDADYSTEDVGIKFKSCMDCLQKSKKVNESESDLHWYLYNLRYTLSTCLFSIPAAPPDEDVDSPCVIDHACRQLKEGLTSDNLTSTAENTYGYCSADGGSFASDKISSCVSCLQASGNQVYLSNFMTVLEAGCEQEPKPGELLGVTGTIFSSSSVNITAPEEDIRDKPEGAGSSTLTTGAIVGIAVGCGLLFLGGVALFWVYWRRQKKFQRDEKAGYHGSNSGTPDPLFPPNYPKMSASLRSYSAMGSHGRQGSLTAGDYYDKLEEEMGAGRTNYAYDPRALSRGPSSALPTHQAYLPQQNVSRNPSPPMPPAPVHRHTRSYTPESFALQTYSHGGNQLPQQQQALNTHENPHPPVRNIPPPPPPQNAKIPSLVMPSAPKLRLPKKYTPPIVTIQEPTPVDTVPREMQISQPVMGSTSRFNDRPLAGGIVYATEAPETHRYARQQTYGEIPMQSGKSDLYGM